MTAMRHVTLALTIAPPQINEFFPLLQQGVRIPCTTGCTLTDLLGSQWGIDATYVTDRITTIFLDHRAIDSMATTIIRGGATLALSGAMPGLVGATMRRGGHLAAMRGAMTYHDGTDNSRGTIDWIRLKLFNLLLPELGPGFLQRGILIDGGELKQYLGDRQEELRLACSGTNADGMTDDIVTVLADPVLCSGRDLLFSVVTKG